MDTSTLSMMEAKLPPGFRFHPRDEELINDYLARRITGDQSSGFPMMVDVDLNRVEPWDLPAYACVGKEWYFYSQRDKKYATGLRTNRATLSGYWKATGKDRLVADGRKGGRLVGMRKTLVFYQGRAPKGKKTDWVMHEFRMEGATAGQPKPTPTPTPPPSSSSFSSTKEDWVLCRVFYKSRPGPTPRPNAADAGSSSVPPPLTSPYINFGQPPQALISSSSHGFNEQVPCFSRLRQSTPPPLPLPPPPLIDTSLLPNKTFTPASPYMNPPPTSFSGERTALRAVLDHISNTEGEHRITAAAGDCLAESSASFLTEPGSHSMWNPF